MRSLQTSVCVALVPRATALQPWHPGVGPYFSISLVSFAKDRNYFAFGFLGVLAAWLAGVAAFLWAAAWLAVSAVWLGLLAGSAV